MTQPANGSNRDLVMSHPELSPPDEVSFLSLAQNAQLVAVIRKQAREWESSDLMDLAAWIEGSL